ncbi:TRAP transporter substrate-binding protein DctP, partial [Pseudomonas aeruginosa]
RLAVGAGFIADLISQPLQSFIRERTGTELLAVVEEGGFLNFTNGKKPIHGPADFQGLRFRAMDPSQVALYEAFGASGTPIPWTELYMGLRTGVADGQMNPTSYIILGSLYQVQKYLTLANIQYSDQFLVANGDLLDAAAEASRLNREAVAAQQERDLAFLKEKGMQIIQPSADDLAAFREKGQPSYLAWLKTQDIEPRWTEMAFRDAGLATAP